MRLLTRITFKICMAGMSASFNTYCNLCDTYLDASAKWLSCNNEVWGVGPTIVFASAASLFLYHELGGALHVAGDQVPVSFMERTLITSMILGMLALMVHLWVCSMRFFQYYLDSIIKDSPNMLLELTTAGLLGNQSELLPLGTITRFLRLQQPQIHITICWFLALCYADYVRKNYCQRFNMPYLEQWQAQLHARASRGVGSTVARVNSLVGAIHRRLRGYVPPGVPSRSRSENQGHTERATSTGSTGINSVTSRASAFMARVATVAATLGPARPLPADMGLRLLSPSSETTVDAIEKLRRYIMETQCSCSETDSDPALALDGDPVDQAVVIMDGGVGEAEDREREI